MFFRLVKIVFYENYCFLKTSGLKRGVDWKKRCSFEGVSLAGGAISSAIPRGCRLVAATLRRCVRHALACRFHFCPARQLRSPAPGSIVDPALWLAPLCYSTDHLERERNCIAGAAGGDYSRREYMDLVVLSGRGNILAAKLTYCLGGLGEAASFFSADALCLDSCGSQVQKGSKLIFKSRVTSFTGKIIKEGIALHYGPPPGHQDCDHSLLFFDYEGGRDCIDPSAVNFEVLSQVDI